MKKIEILYKCRGYAVVNKPVGADSEDKGEGSVPALVKESIGCDYCAPLQRLDKVVGGCMLVALDKMTAGKLSALVEQNKIQKEYICVCEGVLENTRGDMQDILYYDRQKQKSFPQKKARRGTKDASLSYEVINTASPSPERTVSLVRVTLHTGRTHQIRVQFASRGHSLLGDGKYGSRDKNCSVALVCRAVTIDEKRIECPLHDNYPWNLFENK